MSSVRGSHLPRLLSKSDFYTNSLAVPLIIPYAVTDRKFCIKLQNSSNQFKHNARHQFCSSFSHLAMKENKPLKNPLLLIGKKNDNHKRAIANRINSQINHKQISQFSTKGIVSVKHGCLHGVKDRFNGVWVDLSQSTGVENPESMTEEVFENLLSNSLNIWKSENVSSVWIKVPIAVSHVISVASHYQFEYHHAEGKRAVLCLWMDGSTESRIPRFATHQIGVSGVVINENNREVLVVKDKNKKYNVWKFPGGLSDLGEDIADTAIREVFEETGVQTEFKSILAFRQQHDQRNAFGRSDIYILCRLTPLSFELKPCNEEIEAAQWMSIDELMGHRETSVFSRHMAKLIVRGLEHGFDQVDITPNWTKSVFKTDMRLFHRPLKD